MLVRRRIGGSLLAAASSPFMNVMPRSATSLVGSPCLAQEHTYLCSSSALSSVLPSVSVVANAQRRYNASDAASTEGGGTALDVAMKVNKLKRMHQTGQGQGKKEIERMAWRELNTLSEQQIATAEGKAVALLLNSWAYFARFWEKGKDGPYEEAQRE